MKRVLLWVVSFGAMVGCGRDVSSGPQPLKSAAPIASEASPRVHVDASLVESGRIRLATVEARALGATTEFPGDAVLGEQGQAEAGSLVAGRIASLDVTEGEVVKKGQALARIDAPEAGRAIADLLRARGRALLASKKLERQLALEKQNATSPTAVDEARAEDVAARADRAAGKALLATIGIAEPAEGEEASKHLAGRMIVRAPIDGVVVQRNAVLGAAVTPESSLFTIVALDKLFIRARVPETTALPPVATLAAVRSRLAHEARGAPCEARVVGPSGVIDAASRTTPLRLELTSTCAWLRPGAYVDVSLMEQGSGPENASPKLVVPAEAVVDVRGVPTVFVATAEPGVFAERHVRASVVTPRDVAIESGIAPGERVVVDGAVLLKGEAMRSVLGGE